MDSYSPKREVEKPRPIKDHAIKAAVRLANARAALRMTLGGHWEASELWGAITEAMDVLHVVAEGKRVK